ncbi:type I polyketide synthase [Halalkalibacter sp. APA_J-10(15)]|uniref:type I polyketide synthase n=1 Tax=Halalkalibacter sp. APA_J-10(15) TaxID=2933805 RepID=UPI001FF5E782|nr:type I polyketide synthase [Halalkalibacter sp. APA_J-10(15)]MCK0471186.1 SDR family NAD(P)-dependent oxidoreductase [Halalkalibacter sp. APA_J-10(15)]
MGESISIGKKMTKKYTKLHNLADILIRAAEDSENGITYILNDESEVFISYKELLERARRRLGGLQSQGIKPGEYVLIVLEDNLEFVITFWACVLGGIIAAPLAYPSSLKVQNTSLEKLETIWGLLKKPAVISDNKLVEGQQNQLFSYTDLNIINSQNLDDEREGIISLSQADSPAFIQFSSGSTSTPKGVVLTHNNLLANIDSIISSAKFTIEDRSLSWMPYHHDMGLIGFHFSMMAVQINQFNMTPLKFVKKPFLWLDLVTKHKITLTGSPNFGYRLFLDRVKEKQLQQLDLSSLRLIFNGAEPISVSILNHFVEKLVPYGLNENVMYPVYGMAEACVAVSFPPCGTEPTIRYVNREKLANEQIVETVNKANKQAMALADEGFPIDGMSIRIVDDEGYVVDEGVIGEIQIVGPNVTSGYINNEEANAKAFQEGWLKTGDTGFLLNGRLTVVGRIKDIIFLNGQNFYAHDIEAKVEEVKVVKEGKMAVCGWHDEKEGKDRIALFTSQRVKAERSNVFYSAILRHVNETIGIPIDYVVTIKSIPKTTSGKVRRFELIERFKNDEFKNETIAAEDVVGVVQEVTNKQMNHVSRGMYIPLVRKVWAEILQVSNHSIPLDQSFLTLGGTSIKAIQVLAALEEELQVTLSHDLLIQCRTVQEMDDYLCRHWQEKRFQTKRVDEDARVTSQSHELHQDIAVIAMSCRFPDADTPEQFWDNLLNKKISIRDIPRDRFNIDELYSELKQQGKSYCKKGAFIQNPYHFDAELFSISDEEAKVMDPQQRIMLELVFELLERGGYTKQKVSGQKIGLFIGAGVNTYYEYHLNKLNLLKLKQFSSFASLDSKQQEQLVTEWKQIFGETSDHPNLLVDNILNMVASRVSQEFNFKGPSMVIDTACSSSLISLHMACESIRKGESEAAIAGGINLLLTPTPYLLFSQAGALSETGEVKVFDRDADGFVPGEGAGLVMLKPLEQAMADGDEIAGVIKASAINNDGHSIGVMSPNPDGQKQVVESLYVKHQIDPSSIQYMESHGTGTKIGDPSEVRALGSAFKSWNVRQNSIALGSVKSNIGHLLAAAGIASFMKVLLSLKNKTMVQNVNVQSVNPLLKLDETPFTLLEKESEWEVENGTIRRAAINSFGFGGTNCHLLVEEAPEKVREETEHHQSPAYVIGLAANSAPSLTKKSENLAQSLHRFKEADLKNISYTENVTRNPFPYRKSFVVSSLNELQEKLLVKDEVRRVKRRKIAIMFTGQGSQYVNMAKKIYNHIPAFRRYVEECTKLFLPYLNEDISRLIYGEEANDVLLARTDVTQPVVFTIDYAIGKLLLDLGVEPECMLGHSVGEWVAACLADAVSLEDAIRLVAIRGKLMNELSLPGAMLAVFAKSEQVESWLESFSGDVWIAGYNVTHQAVSGKKEDIEKFSSYLNEKGIPHKRLSVSQAFHTPLMEPMLEQFRKELEKTTFSTPKYSIISNVRAEFIDRPLDADYWLEHILAAVKFEQSIHYAFDHGMDVFLEAGPEKVLTGMVKGLQKTQENHVFPTLSRKEDEWILFLNTIGKLYELGVTIHWGALYEESTVKKLDLPLYPFERKIYAPDFGTSGNGHFGFHREHYHEWSWKVTEQRTLRPLQPGAIVIFADDLKNAKSLSEKFDHDAHSLYFVTGNSEYKNNEKNVFVIDPTNQNDYQNIMKEINKEIVAIIHYWNYEQGAKRIDDMEIQIRADSKCATSLVRLAKEMHENRHEIKYMIITNQAFVVLDHDQIENPIQSISTMFGQVLAQENPHIMTTILDVKEADDITDHQLMEIIVEELNHEEPEESIVAFRQGERYVRQLVQKERDHLQSIKVEDGDTFLITGGLGTVGVEIASLLAEQAKVNLILTGRTELKTVNEQKLQWINRLKQLGANVSYYEVDVSHMEQMKKVIQDSKQNYGALHGVIHAAGVIEGHQATNLLEKDIETIERVLRPKVDGTIVLDQITREEPLKFFVLISSVSASKKRWAAGLSDYAAANYFLDQYSYFRRTQNAPGRSLSINYSLWEESAMAAAFGSVASTAVEKQGIKVLSKENGRNAFMNALGSFQSSVIHVFEEQLTANRVESQTRLLHPMNEGELRSIVYQLISTISSLPVEQIDTSANFEELGIDSINAVKFVETLNNNLQLELNPTLLFEYQTPQQFIQYLHQSFVKRNEPVKEKLLVTEREKNIEQDKDIAIIGIGLRVPGANNPDQYWDLLIHGRNMIRPVPEDRWNMKEQGHNRRDLLHGSYASEGGFIDHPYDFDPFFFGMSPNEAEVTDPQQRIFLEIAWEALQSAGYGNRHRTNKIGVFVGCEQNTYMEHFIGYRSYMVWKEKFLQSEVYHSLSRKEKEELIKMMIDVLKPGELVPDAVAGNGLNEVASRVSHSLNLTGPSMVVNTACSSSLVALHHACESLRTGQAEMAIAGGINLNLSPTPFASLSRVTALSSTGQCRPFDSEADGMVLSEGGSAVLLKPLKKAKEDNDYIYCVVKGSALNNDGRSKGITAPRPQGQAEAIRDAYEKSGVNPETLSYVEAHGTATPLGDPIEIEGLTQAFRTFTNETQFCGIGSVKGAIGHMLAASGMTSLIKVALSLKHKTVPHTINYEKPNPNVVFSSTPFYVVDKEPIKLVNKGETPLRAGVNAFGFGGTNAHVILEEANKLESNVYKFGEQEEVEHQKQLLQISGRNEHVVKRIAQDLKTVLKKKEKYSLGNICYSMNMGQKEMNYKVAMVVSSKNDLFTLLTKLESGQRSDAILQGKSSPYKETFVHLYLNDSIWIEKKDIETISTRFPKFGMAYRYCMDRIIEYTEEAEAKELRGKLERFAIQYAYGEMLKSFSLNPKSIICEGTGIWAGAVLAGYVSITDLIEQLVESKEMKPSKTNTNQDIPWDCLLVTPSGIKTKENNDEWIQGLTLELETPLKKEFLHQILSERDLLLECGNLRVQSSESISAYFQEVVTSNGNTSLIESILQVMGQLFVAGVSYNPGRVFQHDERKVPLPTYPFERRKYKVTYKERDEFFNQQEEMKPVNEASDLESLTKDLNVFQGFYTRKE